MYASSPLANLQTNISDVRHENINLLSFFQFFNNEIIPDFISKRINSVFELEKGINLLIDPNITTCTVYAGSYFYLSWYGLYLMGIFILVFPLIYIKLLPKNSLLNITGIAILNTLYLFFIFDNMFYFSGLSFQLIYPLILRKILKPKKMENTSNGKNYKSITRNSKSSLN
ncbi:MAG: hypothetical protein HC908_11380 [Calothrix sp. SM1_7_51]|nr:hypothetical protein [Calothrix sp. SM1_7_51]